MTAVRVRGMTPTAEDISMTVKTVVMTLMTRTLMGFFI